MVSFPDLTAVVLAAGLSRRAAPHHKLVLPAPDGSGRTVVRATVESICESGCSEILVVTGHRRERIETALAGLPVRFVFAPDFAGGMGHSLAAGVRAADQATRGFAIVPGDLPELTRPLVRRIIDCFVAEGGQKHIIPTADGVRGHPAVLVTWLRPHLESLTGDVGARLLLQDPVEAARTRLIEVGDRAILCDVDVA